MTCKERFELAVSHKDTDRPPIQIYLTPEMKDILTQYFSPESYLDAFEIDFREVVPRLIKPLKQPEPGSGIDSYDEWEVGYKKVSNNTGGVYVEAVDLALARIQSMEDVENYPWPSPDDYDYSNIPDDIEKVKDYVVFLGHPGMPDIINGVSRGRGMEQVLIDIGTEDEVGMAIIDKRVAFFYEWSKRSLEAGNGKIDVLCIGEDLGTQNGPVVSPATFDRVFRPRIKRFIDLAHEHGAKAMMHSCGSTRMLQSRLIDMGLDILDAVQPEPVGQDPEGLKRDFGSKLTYCGMISTQQTLPFGTVEECRAEARHRLDVIAKGGGYIFSPAHNIQPDTALNNVLAIYEEATGKKFIK